nr:DUF11 domain-containing protein [Clostridium gasigenes]
MLNNTSSICVEVREFADIAVKKKCSICPERLKNIVNFKIRVSNFGPSTARDVILEDRIQNGISDVKFSMDEGITCEPWTGCLDIGTLKSGESITIIIEGILKSSCKRTICNTAKVCSATCDPDLTNNTSSVIIKSNGCNNRNRCCGDFENCENFECSESKCNECFECDECSRCNKCREDRNCNCIRDDF